VSFLLGLIACSSAFGQTGTAFLMDLGNGKIVGIVTLTDGSTVLITDATVFKIPPLSPPPSPVNWKVEGLYVLVMDDENLRGNLPQSQVNIFTSKPLADWLKANAKGYRFTSNDSLQPNEPARELEAPEFVAGWDLAYSAVDGGKLSLPVMIVSNGTSQTLEPLPQSVDAMIKRLEDFK